MDKPGLEAGEDKTVDKGELINFPLVNNLYPLSPSTTVMFVKSYYYLTVECDMDACCSDENPNIMTPIILLPPSLKNFGALE